MYYVNECNDLYNNKFYIKFSEKKLSKIIFNYFDNTLKLDINLYLRGDYNLPHNIFYLYITSNIGNIDQFVLNLVDFNNYEYHYRGICNIDLKKTNINNKELFLEYLNFDCLLKVDYEIVNDLNINLDKFILDVNKIDFYSEIDFSNYFPISKLSEYYINKKYLDNYKYLEKIPNDFYIWSTNKQINYPDIWVNKINENYNDDFQVINALYYSNIGFGKISDLVKNLDISIDYYINNEMKTLNVNNHYLTNNYLNNCLYLGISTMYDFNNNELKQILNNGINGIYFPIKTSGNINISFIYNNFKYKDVIPFSYTNNFYSSLNQNLSFKIEKIDEIKGYWTKIEG